MIKGEPKLEELLSEPMVLLRAKSAVLSPEELRALCNQVRAQLAKDRIGSTDGSAATFHSR